MTQKEQADHILYRCGLILLHQLNISCNTRHKSKISASKLLAVHQVQRRRFSLIFSIYSFVFWKYLIVGAIEELEKHGSPHIIGSYRMDLMAANDLDIDVENSKMSLDKLYVLSDYIIKKFRPVWYEAKEERTEDNKTVWFHGFETIVEGQLWNVDIWFFDKDTIEKAERYCNSVIRKVSDMPELKQSIIGIKQELLARKLYSFGQYTGMDVYNAVLDRRITTIDEFLAECKKEEDKNVKK